MGAGPFSPEGSQHTDEPTESGDFLTVMRSDLKNCPPEKRHATAEAAHRYIDESREQFGATSSISAAVAHEEVDCAITQRRRLLDAAPNHQ